MPAWSSTVSFLSFSSAWEMVEFLEVFMKTWNMIMALSCLSFLTAQAEQMGREKWNEGWKFARFGDLADGSKLDEPQKDGEVALKAADYDDAQWRTLDLPHDWGIEGPFRLELDGATAKLPWFGIGWYRKNLDVPQDTDKQYYLDFEGVMSCPEIFVNGQKAGEWKYGYSSFRVDITPYLKKGGENVIAVRVDNKDQSSRWYPGGGIYRPVWLTTAEPVHIGEFGTFVRTPTVSKAKAEVLVDTDVKNTTDKLIKVSVTEEILSPQGKVVASKTTEDTVAPRSQKTVISTLEVKKPQLWDTQNPHLYKMRSRITVDGKVTDEKVTRFGIRNIEWKTDGFYLNGKRVSLNGVCMHHDLGALGSAVHRRGYERQIEILKSMGTNAIRTSHNPPAPDFLDLCDEQGILVIDEAFDTWTFGKRKNGYQLYFKDWHEKDIRNMVKRDRNHPSIILWSSGNEVHESGSPDHFHVGEMLRQLFHKEDPTRLVTVGCAIDNCDENGFAKAQDVFGYNYKPHRYKNFHKHNPGQPFYGSETASTISSRGEYFFPVDWKKDQGKNQFQMSSYDLYAPGWAWRPDIEFAGIDDTPECAGEFVWTGFDYLGEPTPYLHDSTIALNFSNEEEKAAYMEKAKQWGDKAPSRSSYFGIIDLCGFPKDRYYIYQARWMPDKKMAHILPHWNWPDRVGEVTPVHVYTSGDEAELFLNGKSQGVRKKGKGDKDRYRLVWEEVVYEPGELKVVVKKGGKPWAEATQATTGEAKKLDLSLDRPSISGDGEDLVYATIQVSDEKGKLVPKSHPKMSFSVTGPVEIVAVCNGDATDHSSFQKPEISAYNGLAQVILRSKRGEAGKAELTVTSEGFPTVKQSVEVKSPKATTDLTGKKTSPKK